MNKIQVICTEIQYTKCQNFIVNLEICHTTPLSKTTCKISFTTAKIPVSPHPGIHLRHSINHHVLSQKYAESPPVSYKKSSEDYLEVVRETNRVLTVCVFHWATMFSSVLSPSLLSRSLLRFWSKVRSCSRSIHSSLQRFEYSFSESSELWSSSWFSSSAWRNLCQACLNSSISFVIFSAPAGDVLAFTASDRVSMCWRVSSSLIILASSSW